MKLELNPLLRFCFGFFLFACLSVNQGLYASDNAGNYSSWSSEDNQGTGFGPWVLESNNDGTAKYAGNYLATSLNLAGRNSGILSPDSTGNAFSLYANPVGAFVTAKRNFGGSASPTPLAVGESFRVQWVQCFAGGNKGINLYLAGWDDTTDKVLNLRQDGDKFLEQSRGSVNSPTAIENAYNNLTTMILRRAAPDTLILNIQTEDPLDIPYSSTFRSPAPDRVSFYFSNGVNGSSDEPLFNNLSIDADSTPVETRQIKFSVNMGYLEGQSPKGFDGALGDKIYVRGYPSGGWGEAEKVELTREVGGIYSVVRNVAGDTGLKSGGYKFYIEKGVGSTTVVVNSGYEANAEREFDLSAGNTELPVVYFNNDAGSSFSTAYPSNTLTEVAPNGLTYLANYAFGGNETTPATLPVQDTSDPTKLRLVVIYRTDDATLPLNALGGETTADLAGVWSASGVSVENSTDSSPVPANTVRKVISVDRGTDPMKFLRATVTK